jgi:RNA-directed DNA polymerase
MQTSPAKPFDIPKVAVWEACRQVAANKGAPGVGEQSRGEFEARLKDNLYRIWNRMSPGSYMPPPVKAVEIPKAHGGTRLPGVPTVAGRVAQTVVASYISERAEPRFHPDSYRYRPARSARDAVAACRQRCWRHDWVIDLDVQKFFDTVRWDLVLKALGAVTTTPWVLLYVKRWLAAPLQRPGGSRQQREKGTPQGPAVSPVLANLFMHFAFDTGMARRFPGCPFERSAGDAVVHCAGRAQAERVLAAIAERMSEVGLQLHPGKTRLVYRKDANRRGSHDHTSFTFLGFRFRARKAQNKDGRWFSSFQPAMSPDARKAAGAQPRSMRIHRRTNLSLDDLARWLNPIAAGWLNYHGRFHRTEMRPLLQRINACLRRWAGMKYRKLRPHKSFSRWWARVTAREPRLFAHWAWDRTYWPVSG